MLRLAILRVRPDALLTQPLPQPLSFSRFFSPQQILSAASSSLSSVTMPPKKRRASADASPSVASKAVKKNEKKKSKPRARKEEEGGDKKLKKNKAAGASGSSDKAKASKEGHSSTLSEPKPIPVYTRAAIARRSTSEAPLPAGFSGVLKTVSWNVNGLRGLMRNQPKALADLVASEAPHLLFLQETKLQNVHTEDFAELLPGYTSHWSCSTARKGYAGTAVFVRDGGGGSSSSSGGGGDKKTSKSTKGQKKAKSGALDAFVVKRSQKKAEKQQPDEEKKTAAAKTAVPAGDLVTPLGVTFDLDGELPADDVAAQEGRVITVELDSHFVVGLYVPNSGQKLERLTYRTETWDPALVRYLKKLEARGKPVVWTGDLNVAHRDVDIYNFEKPHLKKQAGCTPVERDSFTRMLAENDFVDVLRHLYGDEAQHAYTYWNQRRVGAREANQGLRLDYFITSSHLVRDDAAADGRLRARDGPIVLDTYQLPEAPCGSDHCPVVLTLAI
eukprot:UC1_evm3s1999